MSDYLKQLNQWRKDKQKAISDFALLQKGFSKLGDYETARYFSDEKKTNEKERRAMENQIFEEFGYINFSEIE